MSTASRLLGEIRKSLKTPLSFLAKKKGSALMVGSLGAVAIALVALIASSRKGLDGEAARLPVSDPTRRLHVYVKSEPEGADIFVEGEGMPIGETPVTLPIDLNGKNSVKLVLRKEGYEDFDSRVINEMPLSINLKKREAPPGEGTPPETTPAATAPETSQEPRSTTLGAPPKAGHTHYNGGSAKLPHVAAGPVHAAVPPLGMSSTQRHFGPTAAQHSQSSTGWKAPYARAADRSPAEPRSGLPEWVRQPLLDPASDKVAKMNAKAIQEYQNLNFEEARKILKDALDYSSQSGLDEHPITARTHLNLGVVILAGFKQREVAIKQFRKALEILPDIKLAKSLTNPEVQEAFDEAFVGLQPRVPRPSAASRGSGAASESVSFQPRPSEVPSRAPNNLSGGSAPPPPAPFPTVR